MHCAIHKWPLLTISASLIFKQLICTFHVHLAEIIDNFSLLRILQQIQERVDLSMLYTFHQKGIVNACPCSLLLFNDKRRFVIVYDVNKKLFIWFLHFTRLLADSEICTKISRVSLLRISLNIRHLPDNFHLCMRPCSVVSRLLK